MCHGSLDPKYLMRDIEARAKSLSLSAVQDTPKLAAPAPQPGLLARLCHAAGALLRKGFAHV